MTRIRLLHFIDTLGAGGAERQLSYLLENLERERYDSHVLTIYDHFRHYEALLARLGIPVHSLRHGTLTARGRVGAIGHYLHIMREVRPHIVHSWLHYPNLIARAARVLCPPHRLITSIRTEYSPRQQKIERLTSWVSDFRIVNYTPKQKHYFKNNTYHIANGVLLPPLNSTPPHPFTALMVARFDTRKDHLTLLHALRILTDRYPTDFQLILVGEATDPTTQADIANTITQLNLHNTVQIHKTTHNITSYYSNCDITILPSISEGFSNVILESFAAAKPIIVSEAANRDDLVKHGVNGWVFPTRDAKALASQLENAWSTPKQQRLQMGQNGRRIAEQFTIQRMVEQHKHVYERALSRS